MLCKGWKALGAFDPDERTPCARPARLQSATGLHDLRALAFLGQSSSAAKPIRRWCTAARARTIARSRNSARGDKRLLAVGFVPLDDPELAEREIDEAIKLGCAAIHLPSMPPEKISPTHPEFDGVWARLQDADVPFMLHVGGGGMPFPKAFFNNDRPVTDFLGGGENIHSKDFMVEPLRCRRFFSPRWCSTASSRNSRACAADVSSRARCGSCRGCKRLDISQETFVRTEPSLAPADEGVGLRAPQLKFTPYPHEPVGWIIEQAGPELCLFSSDYPHIEGGRNPLKRFEMSTPASIESREGSFLRQQLRRHDGLARRLIVSCDGSAMVAGRRLLPDLSALFADSNGDGIGDLDGITAHLDYLVSLGIDAIWLNPINPSPLDDWGYDVSDYCDVHPDLGTLASFRSADRGGASARHPHRSLDLVPNHTSNQHPWFVESRSSRTNPKRDWYIWRPGRGDRPPNNWKSTFGGSRVGVRCGAAANGTCIRFCAQQPDLNFRNPEVVEAMHDVIRFWLDRGADGFRVDVIAQMIKDAQFRDNPEAPAGSRALATRAARIRAALQLRPARGARHHSRLSPRLDSYRDRDDGRRDVAARAALAGRLSAARRTAARVQLPLSVLAVEGERVSRRASRRSKQSSAPTRGRPTRFRITIFRATSRATARVDADARARVAAVMLLTMRGTPFIYYGEEIGMRERRDSRRVANAIRSAATDAARRCNGAPRATAASRPRREAWLPLRRLRSDQCREAAGRSHPRCCRSIAA